MTRDMLPFDDSKLLFSPEHILMATSLTHLAVSLPANFLVWAATKQASFLHGRFVWATWDVEELTALKSQIDEDKRFLKIGLQGAKAQDFPTLLAGMSRAI